MMPKDHGSAAQVLPKVPRDWALLILKLRWIGFDEEANRLQMAVSTLPPEARCGVSVDPLSGLTRYVQIEVAHIPLIPAQAGMQTESAEAPANQLGPTFAGTRGANRRVDDGEISCRCT
jgi:hypothetical protein